MFNDVRGVLENLNSALCKLRDLTTEAETVKKEAELQKMKQDEQQTAINQKDQELNAREGRIKNIESVVDFQIQAKKLMDDAKALMKNAEERQEILEKGLHSLAERETQFAKSLIAKKYISEENAKLDLSKVIGQKITETNATIQVSPNLEWVVKTDGSKVENIISNTTVIE